MLSIRLVLSITVRYSGVINPGNSINKSILTDVVNSSCSNNNSTACTTMITDCGGLRKERIWRISSFIPEVKSMLVSRMLIWSRYVVDIELI